jgi:prefoldin subunit 5
MELDALAARLAAARVRYQTGGFEAALTEARAITTAARALQYRPFAAEAGLLQGQLEHRMNQIDAAIATLETAVWAAEAGRNDEVAARGWVLLVFLVGYEHNDPVRAQEFAQRTSAAIARLGGNNDIEASLEQALGAIAANQNKLAEAVTHFQKAIPLLEKQFGADHPNVAGVRENLATALLMQGDARGAVLAMQEVLAMREKKLEANHPLIGRARLYLGNARLELGEYALAEQELRAALAILERNLPPTHPEIADLHASLARAVDKLGKRDEALGLGKKATELAEAAYGAEHASFATQLLAFGNQLAAAGREREANDAFTRAEAIYTKASTPADVARVWVARAKLAQHRRPTDAIALLERALPILSTAEGAHEAAAQAMSRLATIYLDRRQPARALAVLARPLDRDKLALETTAELDLVSARVASEAAR